MHPPGQSADVILVFDVEDTFSPPEIGNDDSILEIAGILSEEKVPGLFLFIGDRAEQLQQRGRGDVIRAVARHEVGLHTRSARHPCAPEYVSRRSWDQGVAESFAHESDGIDIIRRVFGRAAGALSAHNVFTSPHAHAVAARLGLPYVYSYAAAPPLYSLSWYCGALCLPWWNSATGAVNPATGPEWDDHYPDPAAFDQQLRAFDWLIDQRLAERQPFLTLMLYHPQRLRLAEFIDHFWSPNGANLPPERWGELGRPRRYSPAEVDTARTNFRRLVQWIRDDPRLRIRTMQEVVARYGTQPESIPLPALLDAAHASAGSGGVVHHARFSAAEILVGMADAVVYFHECGRLPGSVRRADVLGPASNPVIEPEIRTCPWSRVLEAAAECRRSVADTGALPANFGPVFSRFGINHLYLALAAALPALHHGEVPATVALRRTPRCPPEADAIARRFLAIGEGELVEPNLDLDALQRHGRLQTWTLKPAIAGDGTDA